MKAANLCIKFFPESGYYNYRLTQNRTMGNLNFALYDNYFGEFDDKVNFGADLLIGLNRLMYPYKLSKTAKARYEKYILDNKSQSVKNMIAADDMEKLQFLLELGAVVPENLEELTEYCVYRNKTELPRFCWITRAGISPVRLTVSH